MKSTTNKKNQTPINENIIASNLMLIDKDGIKLGLMPLTKALEIADKSSLDLVQVSPKNSEPVVCKLLDYGKFLFGHLRILEITI